MGRRRKRKGRGQRRWPIIFRNRRNPRSSWVPFWDMYLNLREWLYAVFHRVPRGSSLQWRGNRITGHQTRLQ